MEIVVEGEKRGVFYCIDCGEIVRIYCLSKKMEGIEWDSMLVFV